MRKLLMGLGLSMALAMPGAAMAADDAKAGWDKSCAKCHGKEGKGDTKVGKKLKISDYSTAEWQGKVKDDELFKAIKEGKGEKDEEGEFAMPAFATKMTDDQIKAQVAFIRTLKK